MNIYPSASSAQIMINTRGPFLNARSNARRIGGYRHTSLASRTLQLLHELGHFVISGFSTEGLHPNIVARGFVRGTPLLDVDGNNARLSMENTDSVLEHCRQQLDALNRNN